MSQRETERRLDRHVRLPAPPAPGVGMGIEEVGATRACEPALALRERRLAGTPRPLETAETPRDVPQCSRGLAFSADCRVPEGRHIARAPEVQPPPTSAGSIDMFSGGASEGGGEAVPGRIPHLGYAKRGRPAFENMVPQMQAEARMIIEDDARVGIWAKKAEVKGESYFSLSHPSVFTTSWTTLEALLQELEEQKVAEAYL